MAENASKIPEESKPQTRPDLDSLRKRENPSTSSTSSTGGGSTQGTNVGTGGSTQSTSAGGGGSTSGTGGGLYNPGKLKSAEENGGEADDDGGLWNGPNSNNTGSSNSEQKKRFKITRRKAATGGAILVLFGAAGFGGISIMQGPMQLVHLSQILQTNMFGSEESSANRLQGLWRYARSGNYGETRVGKLSSVIFAKTDARLKAIGVDIIRGSIDQPVRINFDLSKLEKQFPDLKGMSETQAKVFVAEIIGVSPSEINKLSGIGGSSGNGLKLTLNTRKNPIRVNRMVNTNAVNLLDNGRVIAWMNARAVNTFTGLPSLAKPLKRLASSQENRAANSYEAAKKAEAERAKARAITDTSKVTTAKSKIRESINGNSGKITGALLITGAMCIVRDTSDEIVTVNRASIVIPSVVESADKTAVGSQVQSNQDVDMAAAGNVVKSFRDVNGKTIWDSKELQATANPSQSSKGTELPRDYQQAFNKDTTAANMNDSVGGGFVGEVACSPAGKLAQIAAAIGVIISAAPSGGMSATVLYGTRAAAGLVATSAVISLLQNQFVNLLKNDSIVPEVFSGPIGGGLLAYGGREMANISARSMGGVELSDTESAQIDQRQQIASKKELQSRPLYAKLFDVNDYRTPAASAVRTIDQDPAQNVASLFSGILDFPKYFSSAFSSIIPKAKAADKPYNWGFNRYGIPAELLNDPQYANPYKNAEQVGKLLDSSEGSDLINRAKSCFGDEVSKGSDGWQVVPIANTDVNPNENDYREAKCDDLGDANWKRMIMFVMDSRTMDATDCYLGETSISEQSCANVGAGGAPTDSGSGTDATITDGTVIELAKKLKQYKEDGKYTCDNPVDCQDIDLMADGKSISCGSTPCTGQTACVAQALDKKILQMTIYLIDKGYKIGTYAFCRAHSKTNGVHHLGRSMDISSINGKLINSASSKTLALEVDKIIFEIKGEIAPKQIITGGVGKVRSSEFVKYNRQAPGNEGTSAVNAFGPGVMQGHTDHIHVGY